MENYKFFQETVDEVRQKGHFSCSNKELRDELYKELKSEIPTLYKWQDSSFYYLNIIEKSQTKNLVRLVEKREELKKEIKDIENILQHLGINLNELGLD